MKKKLLIIAGIIAIIVVGIYAFRPVQKSNDQQPVVKIGVVLPLTGNSSTFGQAYKRGFSLAEEDINRNAKLKYEIIIEDIADNTKNVPIVAQKFINFDKVKAIISIFDPTANVIAPMASNADVLHIGASWFPNYLKYPHNYNVNASMEEETQLLVDKALKENYKNVVLFTVNQTGFINGTEILKQKLKEADISVCEEINFNFGERDFKTQIFHINKKCNPDLYIIGAFPPESDLLIKQLREVVGKDVNITGLELGLNVSSAADGYWYSASVYPDEGFIARLKEKFGDVDFISYSGMGYAELLMLVEAFENAATEGNIPSAEKVSNQLRGKYFDTVFGKLHIQENGKIDIPATLFQAENGVSLEMKE